MYKIVFFQLNQKIHLQYAIKLSSYMKRVHTHLVTARKIAWNEILTILLNTLVAILRLKVFGIHPYFK